jgi:hypothetical protein
MTMSSPQRGRLLRNMIAVMVLAAMSAIGLLPRTAAAALLSCDIYDRAGTPCVAAHSTTRALFAGYSGSLYQITRASDKTTLDIGLLAQGGYAVPRPRTTSVSTRRASSRGSMTRPRGATI